MKSSRATSSPALRPISTTGFRRVTVKKIAARRPAVRHTSPAQASRPVTVAPALNLRLQQPVPTQRVTGQGQTAGARVRGWVVSISIVLAIVLGTPKLLAYTLHTPFPLAAITSGSMWPILKTGDLVFIQGVKPTDVQLGDIIVFRNATNGTFTIHRVVNLGATTLTTKGDANFEADTPVPYENVVGRTLTLIKKQPVHMPYLGSITVFASNLRPHE